MNEEELIIIIIMIRMAFLHCVGDRNEDGDSYRYEMNYADVLEINKMKLKRKLVVDAPVRCLKYI